MTSLFTILRHQQLMITMNSGNFLLSSRNHILLNMYVILTQHIMLKPKEEVEQMGFQKNSESRTRSLKLGFVYFCGFLVTLQGSTECPLVFACALYSFVNPSARKD